MKLEKMIEEIEKSKVKITQLQEKIKKLEKEKSKQEDEQIIKLVRGADTVSLEKLAEFLEQVKKNGGASLSQSKESEAYDEKNNDTNANSKHFNDGK